VRTRGLCPGLIGSIGVRIILEFGMSVSSDGIGLGGGLGCHVTEAKKCLFLYEFGKDDPSRYFLTAPTFKVMNILFTQENTQMNPCQGPLGSRFCSLLQAKPKLTRPVSITTFRTPISPKSRQPPEPQLLWCRRLRRINILRNRNPPIPPHLHITPRTPPISRNIIIILTQRPPPTQPPMIPINPISHHNHQRKK